LPIDERFKISHNTNFNYSSIGEIRQHNTTNKPTMGKNKKIKQSKAEYKAELAELNKNGGNSALPKKAFFRQRAHANPFSDHALI
jgi:hypothetical protein